MVVFQDVRTGRYQRLAGVVGRHLHTARFESALEPGDDFVVEHQLALQHARDDLPGDIVLGGPESTDRNKDRCAVQRSANGVFEVTFVVSDDRLHHHGNSDAVELLREIERVRIPEARRQKFRTDSDDFCGQHDYGNGFPMMPRRTR